MSETTSNLIMERLLPTREDVLLVTSYLHFYWLRVNFVLLSAPGFSETKPAILCTVARYECHRLRLVTVRVRVNGTGDAWVVTGFRSFFGLLV